jgi:hypothetical protein
MDAEPELPDRRDEGRLLLERIERAKALKSEQARIEFWRSRTMEERGRAGAELLRRTAAALRGRPIPYVKPPLNYPRVPPGRPED